MRWRSAGQLSGSNSACRAIPSATAMSCSASAGAPASPTMPQRTASAEVDARNSRICVALGGGELLVAGSLGAEGDGDHPVPAAIGVEGQGAFEGGEQFVPRAVELAGVAGCAALLQRGLERVQQELTLVGEVVRQRPGGPAGLRRHLTHRRRPDAGAGDQLGQRRRPARRDVPGCRRPWALT